MSNPEPEGAAAEPIPYSLVESTLDADTSRAWNDVSPKVTAGALGAAVATIATWAAEAGLGIEIPVSVETAAALVVAFVLGYLVPDTR